MEFLKVEDSDDVASLTETSEDKTIIDTGAETESRLGDPAVELEAPETWSNQRKRNNSGKNIKRLRLLHVIGGNRYFF